MSDLRIGELIREGIRKKRWTYKELGEEVGVGQTAISQWVNNHSIPPGDKLIKVINVLNIANSFFPRKEVDVHRINSIKEKVDLIELELRVSVLERHILKGENKSEIHRVS